MNSVLQKLVLGVLAVLLLVALAIWLLLRASMPVYDGEAVVPGMAGPAIVRFDEQARPYVRAQGLGDALAVQGWLHATERLWQMEMLRRAGRGRLAELLGPGMLATDRELWRFGVPQLADQLAENAGPKQADLVQSYLAGVNAAIDRLTVPPPEFLLLAHRPQHWEVGDVYALGALMAFQSARNAGNELLRLALREQLRPEQYAVFLRDGSERDDFPFVLPQPARERDAPPGLRSPSRALAGDGLHALLERFELLDPALNPLFPRFGFGSNGWVVGPGRSKERSALFAFDSHDVLGLPNLFYEVHLFYGDRQLRGWSVAGLPGVINGFNDAIAWGFTNIGDTQDLFIESRSPSDPAMFRDGEEWYPARVEMVEIPVRGREQPEALEILHSRNGPLISHDPPISLRWTVQSLDGLGLDALMDINVARTWTEFSAALDGFAAPSLNATYADVGGNIGFRTAGLLPLRGAGDGLEPLAGNVAANRWRGIVPASDMPQRDNPPQQYLAAANARVNPPGNHPLVSADNAAPYRIKRLQDVLGAGPLLNAEAMADLQVDWYDGQASLLLAAMLESIERASLSGVAAHAVGMLEEWWEQPVAAAESGAALVFQQWYIALARRVLGPALDDELMERVLRNNYLVNHAVDGLLLGEEDELWWPEGRSRTLALALEDTVGELADVLRTQPGEWRLDDVQRVGLEHELASAIPLLGLLFNVAPQPWGGSPAAVGRANYRYSDPFRVYHGATVRVAGAMTSPPAMAAVIPGGQSGHPLSPHYTDQFETWLAGRLYPLASRPEAVGKPGERGLRLVPPSEVR